MVATAKASANEFLRLASAAGRKIDPLQMQKLVYLAQGWSLAIEDAPLFREPIEAWDYGPVVPDLYHALKGYGSRPIASELYDFDWSFGRTTPSRAQFTERQAAILETVWEVYGHMTGPQLIKLTHEPGSPWHNAYFNNKRQMNARISEDAMRDWFLGKFGMAESGAA